MNTCFYMLLWFTISCSKYGYAFWGTSTKATRSNVWSDVREKTRLLSPGSPGLVLTEQRIVNLCALACGKTPQCRSFNFAHGRGLCELNSEDAFSIGVANQSFLRTQEDYWTFYGMDKNDVPKCLEKLPNAVETSPPEIQFENELKDIQDDVIIGVCEINAKRVDQEWNVWGDPVIDLDNTAEYRELRERTVAVEHAHGGLQQGTAREVFQWFHWVRQKKTWDQAKIYCESMGGKLFSDLDGTEDQLNWLVTKMGENHWIGIYRKTDGASDWFTTEDELLDSSLLNWGANQQTQPDERWVYVRKYPNNKGWLHDKESHEYPAVCDMLV